VNEHDTPPRGYRVVAPPPPPPPDGSDAGTTRWWARHPAVALAGLVVALLAGLGIGFAAGRSDAGGERERADSAEARLADVSSERDGLRSRAETAERRAAILRQRVRKLSAKGDVPSFVGSQLADVESDQTVAAYNWKISTTEQISTQQPGTVLSQSPSEGTTLKAGRSIQLVIAKKAPPKPKQWITIQTLSGADSTKTNEFTIPSGAKARLLYDMPQDTNNAITLYRPPHEYVDLLLNEIGPQQGSTRLYERGTFYLDVTGSYTIQVQVFKRPA
jgi:PASTA domain